MVRLISIFIVKKMDIVWLNKKIGFHSFMGKWNITKRKFIQLKMKKTKIHSMKKCTDFRNYLHIEESKKNVKNFSMQNLNGKTGI